MMELVSFSQQARLLDIGSGAGFPWIVHKIVRPDLMIVSVDARQRKIEFQRTCVRLLNLENCELVAARLETLASQEVDYAIAKALGKVEAIAALALPHIKNNGLLVLPRSEPTKETAELATPMGYRLELDATYQSTPEEKRSRLLVLKKS